jgi:putative ABC transport system ATP-binding protein
MLKLVNISKTFQGACKPVLKNIQFNLQAGDFCVVIGSNGSGKSTLLKTISGEYTPDQGHVMLNGEYLTHKNRSQLIASVIQDINQGTIPDMTLLENMILSLSRVKKLGFSFYQRRAEQVTQRVKALNMGLEAQLHQPLSHLSGGQRQMVATLMAVAAHPKLLLLDEHTSALDPHIQKSLMMYTRDAIATENLTCMMITHKLDDAIQFGNRLIMLHKGRIAFDIAHEAKSSLQVHELLALFHHYEDLDLLEGSL